ncbi:MAG: flagellar biosynthetic protein FliQ [Myxococcota bacterium]
MTDTGATLFREGLLLLAVVGGPVFGVLFFLGLGLGVFQAATQVNDPAVGFLPRVVAAVAVCGALGGWMVEHLAEYLKAALVRMAQGG